MINVLFISSGNSSSGLSVIIKNQGESLKKIGINVSYFTIEGKGIINYLLNVPKLRKHIKKHKYDLYHAHYSLSAFVVTLSNLKPLIVSLMGSDVKSKYYQRILIKTCHSLFWSRTIVKSMDMAQSLKLNDLSIVPNGVDLDKFKIIDKKNSLDFTQWNDSKKHILFAANPKRREKNFILTKSAFDLLRTEDIELHYLENVDNLEMPYYYNAADVVVLTSLWEGSPNVIKEALACNVPIVSTNVGDVKSLIENIQGCYIAEFNALDVSKKIQKALDFNSRVDGRKNISFLNEKNIANKIFQIYRVALNSND